MNYFNLKENIIDDKTWQVVLERESFAKYKTYITDNGTTTKLQAASAYPSENSKHDPLDPFNIILDKFNPKLVLNKEKFLAFIKFDAGCGIFPHTDDSLKRSTIFSWAVNLDSKYFEPILFHDLKDKSKIIDKGYYKKEGIVFNTQKVHSVEQSDRARISFQICFSNTIEEIYTLYTNGELFK
jgi:hypothetical protein